MTLALLTLAPANCSAAGGGGAQGKSSSAKAPSGVERIATNGSCKVVGNLEGKFGTSAQMDDYLACLTPGIEQWIGSVYSDMRSPKGFFFVAVGVTGKDGNCKFDDATLAYCGSSENVYLGERAVWDQYTKHGDAASALIMAHEVTHHFQNVLHFRPARVAAEQIRYENQADCGGGAFIKYANQQGWIDPKDDLIDVGGSLAAAGAGPGPQRDHGSAPERLLAFFRGSVNTQQNPLSACNRYVPEIALVS
ncbi:MAG: neutral zinc metallopeptidase [Mycobacteriales bacterium]